MTEWPPGSPEQEPTLTTPLDVVVLTSSRTGMTAAAGLRSVPAVRSLTLVTAPHPVRPRSVGKLRRMVRGDGALFVLRSALAALRWPVRDPAREMRRLATIHAPGVEHLHLPGFHTPECLRLLRELKPDIGVVVATHKLRPEVFSLPRLGSINLHLGKAPEFRGSSPGFWELYLGVPEVGVTVHRVTDTLDGGDILAQEVFPLDIAPHGDPIRYLRELQLGVLWPNGVRMLGEALTRIAAGNHQGVPQDHTRAKTFRRATRTARRELRRRVRQRRRTGSP
jgi:hypothetical protein